MKKVVNLQAFADWLDNWHVIRIFQALSSMLLIVTLFAFYSEEVERNESKVISAWQIVSLDVSGNVGKREALELLNEKGMSLNYVNLRPSRLVREHGVYLAGVQLDDVDMNFANLSNSILIFGKFRNARLSASIFDFSNMAGVDLSGAYLNGASLQGVNLSNALLGSSRLVFADLRGVTNLECSMLKKALGWQYTFRDERLLCGKKRLSDKLSQFVGIGTLSQSNLTNTMKDIEITKEEAEYLKEAYDFQMEHSSDLVKNIISTLQ
ncbi:pentapeptide repeat-containing protein [Vibrio parahaemolyticus]|uniref:pentapeptide repeat-containing protein n=1 Tax=Vibrio parahaemolyticus TaxID=670 RepID=UPI0003F4C5F1|nr:pentapeptide repeat-containing protein [Vibrio parahaemolyticus]MBE4436155.1 pentapeptide repeat-containing protein [Vibrio parahaemolyticus]MDF4815583.1 pentapeptide repeat-containing protein [Vibrio parahaemolyticus]MDF4830396.1 pentapeptide repeat-containing protein [Vibrio parahaemolyticus]MDF4835146.1 pentapeptide repeat-containing protein [Vibrio parahaemolyticus]MEA5339512.1 pentapeptide repeat-containing protein [Vibrio parahaemolyticus]